MPGGHYARGGTMPGGHHARGHHARGAPCPGGTMPGGTMPGGTMYRRDYARVALCTGGTAWEFAVC